MDVRRVVTKNGPNAKGVVVVDASASRTHDYVTIPQMSSTLLWATEPGELISSDDVTATISNFLPAPGGTRLIMLQISPDGTIDPSTDPGDIFAENLIANPGIAERFESDGSGMHTTPTIDYVIVIKGVLDLDLGDGEIVSLEAGDVVVQCGARHAWRNHTSEPATAVFVLIGAATAEEG
jgi:mannose-6-phosphate isomerase-like protein (cupin superfamily)